MSDESVTCGQTPRFHLVELDDLLTNGSYLCAKGMLRLKSIGGDTASSAVQHYSGPEWLTRSPNNLPSMLGTCQECTEVSCERKP